MRANDSTVSMKLVVRRCLSACDDPFAKWIERICVLLLGLMTLTVSASIITRFIVFTPLNFADPLAKYLMMWCAFLGVGLALRKGEHIAVDMLKVRLRRRWTDALEIFVRALVFGFLAVVAVYGFGYAKSGLNSHDPFVFGVSMTIPYLSVPAGAVCALLQLVFSAAAQSVQGKSDGRG